MIPADQGIARTRAWSRLRKLLHLKVGTERRAVLQAAADEIERLRAEAGDAKVEGARAAIDVFHRTFRGRSL